MNERKDIFYCIILFFSEKGVKLRTVADMDEHADKTSDSDEQNENVIEVPKSSTTGGTFNLANVVCINLNYRFDEQKLLDYWFWHNGTSKGSCAMRFFCWFFSTVLQWLDYRLLIETSGRFWCQSPLSFHFILLN